MFYPGVGIGVPQTELQTFALGIVHNPGLHAEPLLLNLTAGIVFDHRIRHFLIDKSQLDSAIVFGQIDQPGRKTVIAFRAAGGKE